ncbi:MAG: hypothetical protein ACRC30_00980 [Clostridium sp.]
MECLLEGTQSLNGTIYPKQISSLGDKSILGFYLRQRLNVSATHQITMSDLINYGGNNITGSHICGNRYRFDFN